jgi:hypothetical protein
MEGHLHKTIHLRTIHSRWPGLDDFLAQNAEVAGVETDSFALDSQSLDFLRC